MFFLTEAKKILRLRRKRTKSGSNHVFCKNFAFFNVTQQVLSFFLAKISKKCASRTAGLQKNSFPETLSDLVNDPSSEKKHVFLKKQKNMF